MTTNTSVLLKAMNVIFWILFIGLCIQTGALLISFFVSLFIHSEGASDLYMGLDLSSLYSFDLRHYVSMMSLIIFLSAMKAYLAFLVVRIFMKFSFSSPFNARVIALISSISHLALGAGIVAFIAEGYDKWLFKKGVSIDQSWDSGAFLFLAGIIFIIAEVFKKGYELKKENDLTV